MIKVTAKMVIKDDMAEELKSSVLELVAETRKEAGCLVYQLFQDVNNQKVFTFVEEWESTEALEKHLNSKHFKEAGPKLAKVLEKDMEINVYTLVM
ncbi:MAG TPA: putative quinol monooxygenase [Desulfosporosinus sp.]